MNINMRGQLLAAYHLGFHKQFNEKLADYVHQLDIDNMTWDEFQKMLGVSWSGADSGERHIFRCLLAVWNICRSDSPEAESAREAIQTSLERSEKVRNSRPR